MERVRMLRRSYERPETLQPVLRGYLEHARTTLGPAFGPRLVALYEHAIALNNPSLNVMLATIFVDTELSLRQHVLALDPSHFNERFLDFSREMCTRLRGANFDETNAWQLVNGFADTVANCYLMTNAALVEHVLTTPGHAADDAGTPSHITAETLAASRYL
jgi:hypothetical protein